MSVDDEVVLPQNNVLDLRGTNFTARIESDVVTVSIKPMLFAGVNFDTDGGWYDFQGFFDSVEDAKNYNSNHFPWAHIVENGKITWKRSGLTYQQWVKDDG